MPEELKSTIKFHRHAEVIVPDRMDLEALRYVFCRTQAEQETLVSLLPVKVRNKWNRRVGATARGNLFYMYWTFVDEVERTQAEVTFKFNSGSRTPGPFQAHVDILEHATGLHHTATATIDTSRPFQVKLSSLTQPQSYTARLLLDDQLAFMGDFPDIEVPF